MAPILRVIRVTPLTRELALHQAAIEAEYPATPPPETITSAERARQPGAAIAVRETLGSAAGLPRGNRRPLERVHVRTSDPRTIGRIEGCVESGQPVKTAIDVRREMRAILKVKSARIEQEEGAARFGLMLSREGE